MDFTDLNIHPKLLAGIQYMGLEKLTPIQEQCLKPALEGRDLAGIAQTGTGKTIAFLMPIIDSIFSKKWEDFAALIITPTRELCIQIAEEAVKLSTKHPLKICSLYGGEEPKKQLKKLETKPHLIVATPGRLIDFIKQKKIQTQKLHFLVLDEADRIFDMGFIHDIRFILNKIPPSTQIMIFSATLSYSILNLAREYMKEDLVEVRIESETVAVDRIHQKLIHLGKDEKNVYLINQILMAKDPRAIIFTNYRYRVETLAKLLQRYGIKANGISSLLNQKSRIKLLNSFKIGDPSILVATDLASRGLDIDDLSHIFNYDLPQDPEAYVHRIGRTARAGKNGISISYCCEEDYENLPRIERYLGQKIPVASVDPDLLVFPKRSAAKVKSTPKIHASPKNRNHKMDGKRKKESFQQSRQQHKQSRQQHKQTVSSPEKDKNVSQQKSKRAGAHVYQYKPKKASIFRRVVKFFR